jgi:hypothetical protein
MRIKTIAYILSSFYKHAFVYLNAFSARFDVAFETEGI